MYESDRPCQHVCVLWHWSEDAFPPVAFCIHALILDGLRVPPFDRHGDGDARLRALGLDAAMWRAWVAVVVEQRAIAGELARALGTPEARGPLLERALRRPRLFGLPASLCPGSDELRARLDALFTDYRPAGDAWKRRIADPRHRLGSASQQRALWNALTPFHDRLATLSVFLVEYGEAVVIPLPPTACLIVPRADGEGYGRQVIAAAEALAAAS